MKLTIFLFKKLKNYTIRYPHLFENYLNIILNTFKDFLHEDLYQLRTSIQNLSLLTKKLIKMKSIQVFIPKLESLLILFVDELQVCYDLFQYFQELQNTIILRLNDLKENEAISFTFRKDFEVLLLFNNFEKRILCEIETNYLKKLKAGFR